MDVEGEVGRPSARRRPEVAIALDVASLDKALRLVDVLGPRATLFKVGLELFARAGPGAVEALRRRGKRVFLDLKLHDIPNTVGRAVTAVAEAGADLLTVHAAGGGRMMEAAAEAAATAGGDLRLVGVTVLTSLSAGDLAHVLGREVPGVEDEVLRLAELAVSSGLDGVVASALEVAAIRRAIGPEPLVVTPGIRLPGGAHHDQERVSGPAEAVRKGADCLVVGRAVTAAPEPRVALEAILGEITSAQPFP